MSRDRGIAEVGPAVPDVLVLQAVSRALMAWDPLETGAQYLLAELARVLNLSAAVLWLWEAGSLLPRSIWVEDTLERLDFEVGLLGPDANPQCELAVLASDRSAPQLDLEQPDAVQPGASGSRLPYAIIAVPAQADADTLGVVVGYGSDVANFVPPSLETLGAAGRQLGDLLERWQFQEDHARLTRRELELLALIPCAPEWLSETVDRGHASPQPL